MSSVSGDVCRGCRPALGGRRPPELLARRVAAILGVAAGFGRLDLAWPRGITPQAVGRMVVGELPAEVVAVTRTLLVVVEAVAGG